MTNTFNNGLDALEEKGRLGGAEYYKALQEVEMRNQEVLKQQIAALTTAMEDAVNSGAIDKYSQEWLTASHAIWEQMGNTLFNCREILRAISTETKR